MARPRIRYKPNFSFVKNKIPQARERVGKRQGALVRTIQKRSMRKAKRKPVDGLTLEQWRDYEQNKADGLGDTRPYQPSEPGQPPAVREGTLKKLVFYAWDAGSQSVVVGPEKLPGATTDAPAVLEGTVRRRRFRPRPSAKPALMAAKDKLPELWAGQIK